MPKPLKIRQRWFTNLDMPCNGANCKTSKKPLPHTHRRRLGHDTREAAQASIDGMSRAKRELKRGIVTNQMSWRAFKEKFMVYSQSKNAQTHYRDSLAIRYLEQYFPISELNQITPELLISLRLQLEKAGKRPWNINRVQSALKAMMRFAESSRYIDLQIWRLARSIPTPKGRLKYWEENESEAIYKHSSGIWLTVARLAIEAGLRRGEIWSLKSKNVDFERNRIHIVGDEYWIPKDHERRFIPMKEMLKSYLKKVVNGSEYVLGNDRPNLDVLTNYFRTVVKRSGVQGSIHTGRHTYGARQTMSGIPIRVLQERMGHDSIKTTEIYNHLAPEKAQKAWEA